MINRKWLSVYLIILFLTMIGGFLRFYSITTNPPSLSIDEVSFGYNAYSILKTGRDEYGTFLPITFKSVGDYKNPVPIYSMVPSIAIFGLNEFGIRFPTALIATISIPIFYLLFFSLMRSVSISLIATALLAISPWHILYSRYVSDHSIATSLVVIGVLFFLKMLKKGWVFSLISAAALMLSMYTYYPERLFVPLLILTLLILNYKILLKNRLEIYIFLVTAAVLVAPLAYLTFFGPDKARAAMVFITKDIEYTRYVSLDHLYRSITFEGISKFVLSLLQVLSGENLLLFFFWIRKYLNYFEPSFLFYNGLNMTMLGSYGLGVLHLFELPWLLLGVWELMRKNIPNGKLIIFWVLIGLLPASLTNNEQNAGRSLIVLPMILLISAIGATKFFVIIKKIRSVYLKNIVLITMVAVMIWSLVNALLVFSVHFPKQRGEAFMEGTKQTVEYVLQHKNEYQEIVFDPKRGVDGPYIVSIPYMYILFYSKYDPLKYQTDPRRIAGDGFDKFTIRDIDWRVDKKKYGTLFIGSPWSLPLKDIGQDEIKEKVYLSNGQLAFLIVSPTFYLTDLNW